MDNVDPSYLQHEYETSARIKSRPIYISGVNSRRNSFQQSRRRSDGLGGRSGQVYDDNDNVGLDSMPAMSENKKSNRTIPERVSQFYYSLGLFCSSHPYIIITLASLVVMFSCYPLISLPFLGNKRGQEFVTPYANYAVPSLAGLEGDYPRWYRGPPAVYIQQVIIKSAITPWTTDLMLSDAFRGPLSLVFNVTEALKKFHEKNSNVPFSQMCFSVGEVKSKVLKGKISMLPEYGCLIVSPADFWQQRYEKFRDDPDVLATILNYQSHQKGRSGLAEILLGMSVRDTGLKKFPLKSRPRIVSYAITFVLSTYDSRYIDGLRRELTHLYPPTRSINEVPIGSLNTSNNEEHNKAQIDDDLNIFHIYYPSQSSIFELVPLVVTYLAMFIYVYFSNKKIDIITSKLGMAISALVTVVASLCTSVGLCSHFGMTFAVNAKAIYPYLVVIIGLENILVLTRSVVSTANNLDVKIRVAQGLSREGWSITKNLLTEITILTIGFFTFMPAVQEFCILCIVGLLSDFFLQTFFFATLLSVDIHRQQKNSPNSSRDIRHIYPPLRTPIHPSDVASIQRVKSNSQIKLEQNGIKKSQSGISIVAPFHNSPILVKIPKRLRLVYFWAKTRFFQRTFTIFMIGWISVIIYESGIVARFGHEPDDIALPLHQEEQLLSTNGSQMPLGNILHTSNEKYSKPLVFAKAGQQFLQNKSISTQNNKLYRDLYSHNPYIWRKLTPYHWQVLFGVYNVTLTSKYITVLPSICISVPVQPKQAIELRHPLEVQNMRRYNWQALTNAFDSMDMGDDTPSTGSPVVRPIKKGIISDDTDPYIPSSPVELALTVLLAIPSIIFIGYLVVVLYRCICSRNYAEWRSSWTKENPQDNYTEVVFEAVPLVLDGHTQDVECIGSDGNIIASVCLAGTLKVWHVNNGENIVTVDRQGYFEQLANGEKDESYGVYSDPESSACSPSEESHLNNSMNRPGFAGFTSVPNKMANSTTDNNPRFRINRQPQQNSSPPAQGIPIPATRSKTSPFVNFSSSPGHHHQVEFTFGRQSNKMHHKSSNEDSLLSDSDPSFSQSEDTCKNDPALVDEAAIWCLDCQESLVFLGTGTGRLEIWDALNGCLKCIYEDASPAGIVCIKVVGSRIILARLSGSLDFLELTSYPGQVNDSPPSSYHRWHNGETDFNEFGRTATFSVDFENEIRCVWLMTQKAHQQPITCLDCEGGRVLTGSQDHTLKVFRVEDHQLLYTLHGHYGPITCLFIDKFSPMTSGSGSHDGMLCVWDLLTGMCMYSIQAHDGPVSNITWSISYFISVGGDDKICVWERFQGHLLNTIQLDHAYSSSLVMLTQNLLVTSKQGSLIVWDVRSGQPVRAVRLGHRDNAIFVKQIMSCSDAILCDYSNELRLVRFPSVVSKYD